MAGACPDCNGMGWGALNKEFGAHRGTEPCPTCLDRFEQEKADGVYDEVVVVGGKKKTVKFDKDIGHPVDVPRTSPKTTVEVVGGGKVDLNEEPQTVEDLIEAGVVTQEQVDAQNAADLEAMKEEGMGG